MVLDEQLQNSADYQCQLDLDDGGERTGGGCGVQNEQLLNERQVSARKRDENQDDDARLLSFKMPYQESFKASHWAQLAETTLPLRASKLLMGGKPMGYTYGGLNSDSQWGKGAGCALDMIQSGGSEEGGSSGQLFQASIECRSKQMSRKLIIVTVISLLINLLLALVAFYFSFVNNSSSATAFAADCLLDFISSAIVLWRYYGDDSNNVYAEAREQIACIYLGALFEISAVAIIIKASSDMLSGSVAEEAAAPGYNLMYLAVVATIACSVLIWFKWSLYKTIRDKSILLDVINTLISTIFALTLSLMTVLSNLDASFLYFDPILSIVLALFMAGFGLKVIHQNFNILRPGASDTNDSPYDDDSFSKMSLPRRNTGQYMKLGSHSGRQHRGQYEANLTSSVEDPGRRSNWQKTDYSAILFV